MRFGNMDKVPKFTLLTYTKLIFILYESIIVGFFNDCYGH